MEETALEYFQKHKGQMSEGEMVKHLKKRGISERTIEDAREIVLGRAVEGPPPAEDGSFWNIYDKKIYAHTREKLWDFLFGIFAPVLLVFFFFFADGIMGYMLAWSVYLVQCIAIFYFWKRRKFLSFGFILSALFTPFFIFGYIALFK